MGTDHLSPPGKKVHSCEFKGGERKHLILSVGCGFSLISPNGFSVLVNLDRSLLSLVNLDPKCLAFLMLWYPNQWPFQCLHLQHFSPFVDLAPAHGFYTWIFVV